jgi:hypothetical protein
MIDPRNSKEYNYLVAITAATVADGRDEDKAVRVAILAEPSELDAITGVVAVLNAKKQQCLPASE